MLRSWVLAGCVGLSGCLDFGAAYERCVDRGRCGGEGGGTAGGSSGGGAVSSGGGAATGGGTAGVGGGGSTGGGTSGTGGTGGYDGGSPCQGSPRPRLQCGAPWVIADGGIYKNARLAALPGGLVAAWSNGQRVELVELAFDGGVRQAVSDSAGAPVQRVALSSEGAAWALLYVTDTGAPLHCFSSFDDGGVTLLNAVNLGGAVSVSSAGEVAVVRGGAPIAWGIGARGCPRSLALYDPIAEAFWTGAVHVPGTGAGGFRFTLSGSADGTQGSMSILRPLADGGMEDDPVTHLDAPVDHVAILNTAQTHAMGAFKFTTDNNTTFSLGVRSLPIDLTQPAMRSVPIVKDPFYWSASSCGFECLAVAWTPSLGPAHVSAFLSNDDPLIAPRGSMDAGWDVACSRPLSLTSVGVAYDGTQLRFLIAEPNVVSVVSCDVPP